MILGGVYLIHEHCQTPISTYFGQKTDIFAKTTKCRRPKWFDSEVKKSSLGCF